MNYRPKIEYPLSEQAKLNDLESLFCDWHKEFQSAGKLTKHKADDMVFDGFYPNYFNQKIRILFIGWESRQISGENNMDVLYSAYRTGKRIGEQHLNSNLFHRRMLYIGYGINNGMMEWRDIPYADKIGDSFGEPSGLSFAFMNLSKLSNESDKRNADWTVIDEALGISTKKRQFLQEEISILEPHIVIAMRLHGRLPALGNLVSPDSHWLHSSSHRSLLIETAHFSAPGNDIEAYYRPICELVRSAGLPL